MIGAVSAAPLGALATGGAPALDAWALCPLRVEINGKIETKVRLDTLKIDDTLGQPVSCDVTVVNPANAPAVGSVVRVRFYQEVLFAGLITQIDSSPDQSLSVIKYHCTCADWSILLTRRKLRRNFTDEPVLNIVDSILDNELSGDGLTIGTIDQGATLPLVDVKNARAFDVLRDVAGATGQAMFVDVDKVVQFRSTTNDPSPKIIDATTVESSSLGEDLETYRNTQTVIVTGTPSSSGVDAVSVSVKKRNAEQIAARQALEGGTGVYEDIEEVTHPTSNATGACTLLGIGYATLRLATSGSPRRTLRVRLRGYGFRAGQFATVNLPTLGLTGSWLIQRASLAEQYPTLRYDLELTQSSTQQRAYEAWLAIVKAGKVVVQLPSALTNAVQTYDTPGTYSFVVPAGVTQIEATLKGAGGGGGGGDWAYSGITGWYWLADGKSGGNGGLVVSLIDVTPGETLTVIIGTGGVAGVNGTAGIFNGTGGTSGTAGSAGTTTIVKRGTTVLANADSGLGGGRGNGGSVGAPGSGTGDAITVGGGRLAGAGGTQSVQPGSGQSGAADLRW